MKFRCELMIQHVLPGVRSFVAKELVYRYKMNQTEAANLMGISQPAISQYLNNGRGERQIMENKEILGAVQMLAKRIHEKSIDQIRVAATLCSICKMVTEKDFIPQMKKEICPIENFAVFKAFSERNDMVQEIKL